MGKKLRLAGEYRRLSTDELAMASEGLGSLRPARPDASSTPAKSVRTGWVRSAAPILIVNAISAWGQASYAHDHLVPAGTPASLSWIAGAAAAVAAESIALYVNWHAHDALVRKDHLTAGRLRRAAYLVAAMVASVNYFQFSDHGQPTPLALVVAMFTILSPWLWGLHTRRRQHIQLTAEGVRADSGGAVFAGVRAMWFPIRTPLARRWSIDNNITDPDEAWAGYRAYRTVCRAERQQRRAERTATGGRGWFRAASSRPSTPGTSAAGVGPVEVPGTNLAGQAAATSAGSPVVVQLRKPTNKPRTRRAGKTPAGRSDAELLDILNDPAKTPRDADGFVSVRAARTLLSVSSDRSRRLLAEAGLLRPSNGGTTS